MMNRRNAIPEERRMGETSERQYFHRQLKYIIGSLVVGLLWAVSWLIVMANDIGNHKFGKVVADGVLVLAGLFLCLMGIAGISRRREKRREIAGGGEVSFEPRR
jgi:hypothetical protein